MVGQHSAKSPERRAPSRPDAIRRLVAAQLGDPARVYLPGEVVILGAITAADLMNAHPEPKPAIAPEVFRILAERRRRG